MHGHPRPHVPANPVGDPLRIEGLWRNGFRFANVAPARNGQKGSDVNEKKKKGY